MEMTDIYRDPTDGATARRVDLLRRRRDELVTMPHAVRRVVVARGARIAASAAMALIGALLVGSAASPRISKLVGHVLPPDDPAVIATALLAAWIGGALVYAIARSICEHRFAVAMTKCVLPGEDLHEDLERLSHETPDEIARRMAHAREVSSAAMPVLAAALLGPATLAYIALAIHVRGWPANRVIEDAMRQGSGTLILAGVIGVFAMLAVLTQRMRSPGVAVPAGVGAVTAVIVAALFRSELAGAVAAIAGIIAMLGRTLRIERAWIETDDPAAGTELVPLLRKKLGQLRALVAANKSIVALGCAAFAGALVGHATQPPLVRSAPSHVLADAMQRAVNPQQADGLTVDDARPYVSAGPHVKRLEYGVIEVEATFEGSEAELPTGITIPPGWEARVEVHVDYERSTVVPYTVDGIGNFSTGYPFQVITPTVCSTERSKPLRLDVHADTLGTHHVTFVIRPSLTAAPC
jgi:hypothetical protein